MAGKPKPRQERYAAMQPLFARATVDPIPHDPELLRLLVSALLVRIQRRSKKEADYLKAELCHVRAREEMEPSTTEGGKAFRESLTLASLRRIMFDTVPDSPHSIQVLQEQRAMLQGYFSEHKYEPISQENQRAWFQKHHDSINAKLRAWPCWCKRYYERTPLYTDEDDTFSGEWSEMKKRFEAHGVALTIEWILAKLHHTTAENIRGLLKPSQSHVGRSTKTGKPRRTV